VQAVSFAASPTQKASAVEQTMQKIWSSILPNAPQPVPLDESFFDLGGHSILATRLIFEIRKVFVVDAPLGLVFEEPTIAALVKAVQVLRHDDLGLTYEEGKSGSGQNLDVPNSLPKKAASTAIEYGNDFEELKATLQSSYPSLPSDFKDKKITVFLTGATGFLGAFVLKELFKQERVAKVICLIRGSDTTKGLARLQEGSSDRGAWDNKWVDDQRLEVVAGDLGLPQFGLDTAQWDRIASEADVVLHNGALVSLVLVCYELCN